MTIAREGRSLLSLELDVFEVNPCIISAGSDNLARLSLWLVRVELESLMSLVWLRGLTNHRVVKLLDGINFKEYQLKWMRKNIGLVSQEPIPFASSIRDNMAYEMDSVTTEEIKAAAKLANASNFKDELSQVKP